MSPTGLLLESVFHTFYMIHHKMPQLPPPGVTPGQQVPQGPQDDHESHPQEARGGHAVPPLQQQE
eukprot:9137330-Prorocentrum_lima.AAC.1